MKLKRSRFLITLTLILLATLVVATSSVSAETRRISLLNAFVQDGRGAIFTFRVFGDFEKFPGYVNANGNHYKLNCNIKASNGDILVCKGANQGLNSLVGQTVDVVVAGFSFTTFMKQKNNCYSIYDWDMEAGPPNWTAWDSSYCQIDKAEEGDTTSFWPEEWPGGYIYMEEGGFCGPENDLGDGYYWSWCWY